VRLEAARLQHERGELAAVAGTTHDHRRLARVQVVDRPGEDRVQRNVDRALDTSRGPFVRFTAVDDLDLVEVFGEAA
jgi:hypothetical protein